MRTGSEEVKYAMSLCKVKQGSAIHSAYIFQEATQLRTADSAINEADGVPAPVGLIARQRGPEPNRQTRSPADIHLFW